MRQMSSYLGTWPPLRCVLSACIVGVLIGIVDVPAQGATVETSPTDGFIAAIALQPDGKALVGGTFSAIAGKPCHDVCRLNSSGSVDDSFEDVNAAGDIFTSVYALALQPDGKVIVSGIHAPTSIGAQIQNHLLRLNRDGSVDPTFVDATPDGAVLSLALQPDGRIWAGGSFIAIGGQLHANLARLAADGSDDATTVLTDTDDSVRALALRPDRKLWVAGYFSVIGAKTRHSLALLDANGNVSEAFADPQVSGGVGALALQTNRKLWIGGDFSVGNASPRHSLARLNTDGRLDDRVADANIERIYALPPVLALAVQPNGKLWVGGSFVAIDGQPRHYLARLNADGGLDMGFADPNLDGWVFALAVQPDGKVWIGGDFLAVGGHEPSHVVRFNSDGSPDRSFTSDLGSGSDDGFEP